MRKIVLFFFLGFITSYAHSYNIGLLVVATGKYVQFVPSLIQSAEHYFCPDHSVTYFVFTDGSLPARDNVVVIHQERLGWPYDTMMRCGMYDAHNDLFAEMDYLFACDADMLFVDFMGDEILSDRVGTLHPGYVGSLGTYERCPSSTACVGTNEGQAYYAGGFHGGTKAEFLKLAHTMHENINEDLKNGIIAVWHDESHLNRYFATNPPTCTLSPSYCYPESREIIVRCGLHTYQPKLIALDKNHNELRK